MGKVMKNRAIWLITLLVIVFGLSPARAGVTLSDNLSATTQFQEPISEDYWAAASFGTGTQSWTLQSVTLYIQALSGGTAQLDIYKDTNDPTNAPSQPGNSSIGTLSSPVIGTTLRNYTFTPGSLLPLDPNSTYWVVLHALTGEVDWVYPKAGSGGSGIGFQDYWATSDDAGSTWPYRYSDAAFMMQVTAIPEPSTLALFGSAALLFGIGYRRQSRNVV